MLEEWAEDISMVLLRLDEATKIVQELREKTSSKLTSVMTEHRSCHLLQRFWEVIIRALKTVPSVQKAFGITEHDPDMWWKLYISWPLAKVQEHLLRLSATKIRDCLLALNAVHRELSELDPFLRAFRSKLENASADIIVDTGLSIQELVVAYDDELRKIAEHIYPIHVSD